jgi:hypothetical protein
MIAIARDARMPSVRVYTMNSEVFSIRWPFSTNVVKFCARRSFFDS